MGDRASAVMDEAALAAAVAAVPSRTAKAPPFPGPSVFRSSCADVVIWMRLTSVPPGRQAASLKAAMTGVAKRLALRLPSDAMFSDTGVESLLALLRSRFCNAGGTSRKVPFDGLRSCTCGFTTMEDRAIALCEEPGCSLSDAMQVHVVVEQANQPSS